MPDSKREDSIRAPVRFKICAVGRILIGNISVGDSGGPLVCVNETNVNYIYVAGITSGTYKSGASEEYRCGTAGTYGTYTRVTHHIPWIENVVKNKVPEGTEEIKFEEKCPGVICLSSKRCAVRNNFPECLNAEDELD